MYMYLNNVYRVNSTPLFAELCEPRGGGGGGHSLIWPIRGRVAGQGMVFWSLCPEQGIQFYANLS